MPKGKGVSPRITFVLFPEMLAESVKARRQHGEYVGLTARRDLERFYHVLAKELSVIELTEGEASLIVDACNGVIWEPWSVGLLPASIADAITCEQLDKKWSVDGKQLVEKLRKLTYTQKLAVIDAAERFWVNAAEGYASVSTRPIAERLREVGLVRGEGKWHDSKS